MTKYEPADLTLRTRAGIGTHRIFPCTIPGVWNLPVSARFSLKMMEFTRLSVFLVLIILNRLRVDGMTHVSSLIESKGVGSSGIESIERVQCIDLPVERSY